MSAESFPSSSTEQPVDNSIDDIVSIDDSGRGHRPDGKFLSQHEMSMIDAFQDQIRGDIPSQDETYEQGQFDFGAEDDQGELADVIPLRPGQAETQEAEDPAVEELKAEDKAILEQSVRVKTETTQFAKEAMDTVSGMVVSTKNAMSTPKNVILRWRRDRAQSKVDRAQAKIGTSFFKSRNKHFEKVANKKQAKLNARETVFSKHSEKMQGRIDQAETKSQRRDEILQKRLENFKKAKLEAEERKAKRKLRREKKEQGVSYLERNKAMNNLDETDRARIRHLAMQSMQDKLDKKAA